MCQPGLAAEGEHARLCPWTPRSSNRDCTVGLSQVDCSAIMESEEQPGRQECQEMKKMCRVS